VVQLQTTSRKKIGLVIKIDNENVLNANRINFLFNLGIIIHSVTCFNHRTCSRATCRLAVSCQF